MKPITLDDIKALQERNTERQKAAIARLRADNSYILDKGYRLKPQVAFKEGSLILKTWFSQRQLERAHNGAA